jgi:hypothetical protein
MQHMHQSMMKRSLLLAGLMVEHAAAAAAVV